VTLLPGEQAAHGSPGAAKRRVRHGRSVGFGWACSDALPRADGCVGLGLSRASPGVGTAPGSVSWGARGREPGRHHPQLVPCSEPAPQKAIRGGSWKTKSGKFSLVKLLRQ